ncbi:tyrosine-type recombinase/integrase [Limobrevibacterium gyesilva]|uniref:Tyrosine-type recombinase/integrase n=1 Tax=Limobrevibacterium gyesilva TaxID=2991712 RepID=A0AA41YWR1_9PROT|nr:tyrosine-type recombinase/integrase [Limobrevibacterium gyesilva]MCW3477790.1 tyrosine-type recombinase/integrase [Limobrevibacterium gyesilva]
MKRLLCKGDLTRHDAVEFSLFLALEILIFAPMRVENLASLRLDLHIRLPRPKDGETVILLPRHSVKNAEQLQYLLPAETTAFIRSYVERVKPLLETTPSPFLFPGRPGHPKRSDTLSKQLSQRVWTHLGLEYSPHLQRHLTAKMNVDVRPGDYETARRLLGHRSHDTTYRSYEGMETESAARLHDDLIRSKRRHLLPPEGPALTAPSGPGAGHRRTRKI